MEDIYKQLKLNKMKNKNYSISVYDIQFYLVDEDGNEKLDNKGDIQKYQLKPMRFKPLEYLCEDLTENELIKIK